MKRVTLFLLILLLPLQFPGSDSVDDSCFEKALSLLKEYDTPGYKIYTSVDKNMFVHYLDCSDSYYDLPTAVHEAVHMISGYRGIHYVFYMPDGTTIKVERKDLYYRNKIIPSLLPEDKDIYYFEYLEGKNGEQDIPGLLDELNAYTHELHTTIRLQHLLPDNKKISIRDGLVSFMYYLELYLYYGRTEKLSDYNKLRDDRSYLVLIKTLWENAEDILSQSYSFKNLGIYDKYKINQAYTQSNLNEIKMLFNETGIPIKMKNCTIQKLFLNSELTEDEIPHPEDRNGESARTSDSLLYNYKGKEYTCRELELLYKTDPKIRNMVDYLVQMGEFDCSWYE